LWKQLFSSSRYWEGCFEGLLKQNCNTLGSSGCREEHSCMCVAINILINSLSATDISGWDQGQAERMGVINILKPVKLPVSTKGMADKQF
jgi:hypothetical protein